VLSESIFLNQNEVVLVKKQKSTGRNLVFDRVLPGQPSQPSQPVRFLSSSIVFSTRPGSSLESTKSWINPLGRAEF